MPTQATVDRHKRRADAAEQALWRLTRDHEAQTEHVAHVQANLDEAITARDAAQAVDPEALLVADLEAAIASYHERLRLARDRDTYYDETAGYPIPRREPYRPAMESALGRALLHVAARHGERIDATEVYPPPPNEQQIVSVPRHVADQLAGLPMDAFR